MLSEHVAPLMKRLGYKRVAKRWGKRVADGWHVVDVQSSQWSTRDEVRFSIGVGFRSDVVCQLCGEIWNCQVVPLERWCHLREAVTCGTECRGATEYWLLTAEVDSSIVGRSVCELIEKSAMTFLESFGSNKGALAYIEQGEAKMVPWLAHCSLLLALRGRESFESRANEAFRPELAEHHAGWRTELAQLRSRAEKLAL